MISRDDGSGREGVRALYFGGLVGQGAGGFQHKDAKTPRHQESSRGRRFVRLDNVGLGLLDLADHLDQRKGDGTVNEQPYNKRTQFAEADPE